MLSQNFHPSIFYTCLFRRSGRLEPIPAVIGREAGYTLGRSPVHHRATQRQTTTHTLTWREPTHTRGDYANSTQKSPRWGLNLEPSCCEATVLITTPPCSPKSKFVFHIKCKYNYMILIIACVLKWAGLGHETPGLKLSPTPAMAWLKFDATKL